MLKLLQSPIDEYKHVLIAIWARIISFDESCQVDVVKDRAISHFIRHLNWGLTPLNDSSPSSADIKFDEDASEQRTMTAFILSVVCADYTLGQSESIKEKLHVACATLLQSLEGEDHIERSNAEHNLSPSFRVWMCICLGNLTKDNNGAQSEVIASGVHHRLFSRLNDNTPDVRAAACYALTYIIGSNPMTPRSTLSEHQPPRTPQEVSPTIQSMTGNVSGSFNTSSTSLAPNALTPTFSNVPQPNFGIGLHPYAVSTSMQSGMNYLVPGGHLQPAPLSEIRTVFDDKHRLNVDIQIATELSKALDDGSATVRFEASIAINHFVAKYVEGFIFMAGENLGNSSQRTIMSGINTTIPSPNGMDSDHKRAFSYIWSRVLKHYRCEPQPSVRSLLSSIVMSVNECVMSVQSKIRQQRKPTRRQSLISSTKEESLDEASNDAVRRNATGLNLSSYMYGSPQSLKRSDSIGMTIGTPPKGLQDLSGNFATKGQQTYSTLGFEDLPCVQSVFFLWKKVEFCDREVNGRKLERLDLLSDIGAIKNYRSNRNKIMQRKRQLLADSFAVLARPPSKPSSSPYANDIPSALDKEIDMKKQALHLKQTVMLENSGTRGNTSILRFHPYEPALAVCGGSEVTCWNTESPERKSSISNENSKSTRITAASWMNDSTTSLFMTGCSDGSVRVFDGFFEPNDEVSREKPTLVSSFLAAPAISLEKGSTGLILEYQDCFGQLIAGGSMKELHCWDIASEKCHNSFLTGTDAMLTTLESAWKYCFRDGYYGLGPSIVASGFSNGALKLFDVRANNGKPMMNFSDNGESAVKKRLKHTNFDEHSSWIIDVSFTSYSGGHEVSIQSFMRDGKCAYSFMFILFFLGHIW